MPERIFRITNYYDHPTDPNYIVFHFLKEAQADEFEKLLNENQIEFEKFIEREENIIWMFAVRKRFESKAVNLNFLAIGKHRDPFIPQRGWRWALLIFTAICITLAVIGYNKRNTDPTKDKTDKTENP